MLTPDLFAVLAGGILMFILGGLWYSPILFAKTWVPLAHPGKSLEALQAEGAGPAGYALVFVMGLVGAAVTGLLAEALGGGLLAGLAAGAAIAAAVAAAFAGNYHFGGKPTKLYAIDAGYQVVGLVLVGLLYGIWPW